MGVAVADQTQGLIERLEGQRWSLDEALDRAVDASAERVRQRVEEAVRARQALSPEEGG